MIGEDLLERGLGTAADAYEVPSDGVDRLRELLAPRTQAAGAAGAASAPGDSGGAWLRRLHVHRPGPRGWMGLAAATVAVLIAVPIAVGGGGGPSSSGGASSAASGGASSAASGGASGFSNTPGEHAPLKSARVPAPAVNGVVAAPVPAPQSFDRLRAGADVGTTAGGASAGYASAGGASAGDASAGGASAGGTSAGGAPSTVVPNPPAVPERIVKTGELDLEVHKGDVTRVLTRLTALAALERGYVADSRTIEGGGAPSGMVTLRVPVASFDDTVNRARGYGSKVLSLETSAQDVTSRYVDLGARINALQKTRATFLTLLSKATTIGETLAVQQRVSDVQTQIERLQGQRKVLANQSALSTLTVTVNQRVAAVAAPHHESGFVRAVDRSVSRFVRGVEAIVGVIGPILLALILIVLAWLGGRLGYRLLRRRLV
ncbi:MAG TPA: DUF4349 domain-containing protein [Mycobacteriales bacterium]|nr:DUF4349 domain-containing protein [Mycobacteriales bacterium]